MGQISKPLKPVSRRFLLETGASIGFVAATADWASAEPRPEAANAGGPTSGSPSSRKSAAFKIRQAAAQAYLDESPPVHTSNGDEARYEDKRASFSKTLPHNDDGEVDVDAFKVFVSILANADTNGFETIPRD